MATSRKSGARAKAKAKPRARAVAKTAARKPAASSKKRPPHKASRPAKPAAKARPRGAKVVARAPARPAARPAAVKAAAVKAAAVKAAAVKAAAVKAAAVKAAAVKAAAVKAAAVKGAPAKTVSMKTPPVKPGTGPMPPAMKSIGKDGKPLAAGGKKAASAAAGTASKKPKRPVVPEVVRPLGVLPPESIAKTRERPVVRTTPPRPAPAAPARPQTAPQGVQPLTEQDRKYFEEKLLAERAKLMREMGHIENNVLKVNQRESSGDLSGYSFHMADAGTDAYEREKAFLFASSEGRTLLEINEALRRLYGGTFGICETSGKPISRARLEAIPWARYTLEVQEQLEKEERSRRSTP